MSSTSTSLLDRVKDEVIRLVSVPSIASSLKSLAHRWGSLSFAVASITVSCYSRLAPSFLLSLSFFSLSRLQASNLVYEVSLHNVAPRF